MQLSLLTLLSALAITATASSPSLTNNPNKPKPNPNPNHLRRDEDNCGPDDEGLFCVYTNASGKEFDGVCKAYVDDGEKSVEASESGMTHIPFPFHPIPSRSSHHKSHPFQSQGFLMSGACSAILKPNDAMRMRTARSNHGRVC